MDADGRREHRDVAGERLEHGQAEALALGGHDDGVGRVDPQRHALGVDASEREQPHPRRLGERERAVVALLRPRRVGREQQERRVGLETQLERAPARAAIGRKRSRSTPQGSTSARCRARPRGQLRDEVRGGRREQVDRGQHRHRGQARSRVADVGAVHRQRAHARVHGQRGPRGEPEVGVHDVRSRSPAARERRRSRAPPPRARGRPAGTRRARPRAPRAPQRLDLVAHEAPALGMGAVGKHVRDDERAHDAPTVALWNDGAHERAQLRTRPERAAPGRDRAGLHAHRDRLGADLARRDARDLHRLRPGRRSALDGRPRPRLGDGRVRDAAGVDRRAQAARRAHAGDSTERTVEIQRLIGRSLRGVVDFEALGERTIYLDCDVLQADGGTRCASITGAYVALSLACSRLRGEGLLESSPLTGSVAAVSCGMIDGTALLDLDYAEDSTAEVDANVVMTGDGGLVEVQATAERTPLSRAHLDELLALAAAGIEQLRGAQEQAIAQGAA